MAIPSDALAGAHPPALDAAVARRAALATMLVAKLVGAWGVGWDIRWHVTIGRDSFWIAPHVMTYSSVAVTALAAFAALALETLRARRGAAPPFATRVVGLVGPPGLHLAVWGMALTIGAAPLDDLWHRLFGIDVTLWSLPHLLGIAGAQINTLGCLLLARHVPELSPAARRGALILGSTLLLGAFEIVVDQAVQTAYVRGGAFLFTWAVLGAGAFGGTLVLAARLTDRRWVPMIVGLGAVVVQLSIIAVGDVGFAFLRPEPTLQLPVVEAPDSPIALAREMARRNGGSPGRSITLRTLPALAAIPMVVADARARPCAAAIAFAVTLWAISGTVLGRSPALAHAHPSVPGAAVALVLAVAGAVAGAALARRVSD